MYYHLSYEDKNEWILKIKGRLARFTWKWQFKRWVCVCACDTIITQTVTFSFTFDSHNVNKLVKLLYCTSGYFQNLTLELSSLSVERCVFMHRKMPVKTVYWVPQQFLMFLCTSLLPWI